MPEHTNANRPRPDALKKRIHAFEDTRPKMGRGRLLLILASSWPSLLMGAVAYGHKLIRQGWLFPTIVLASLGVGVVLDRHLGPSRDQAILSAMLLLNLLATWALLGVVATVFSAPLSESILSRIERLVQGSGRHTRGRTLCREAQRLAREVGRPEDESFCLEASARFDELEQRDAEETEDIHESIDALRTELARERNVLRNECLLRRFSEIVLVFGGSIFLFAFITMLLSRINPNHFSPPGAMSFLTSLYFSFTTVTTTDFGDIVPVSNLARVLAIWEEALGVTFMTAVIGAAMDAFQGQPARGYGRPSRIGEKRLHRRVINFALRVYRDYEDLSGPRARMDQLLDELETRVDTLLKRAKTPDGNPSQA